MNDILVDTNILIKKGYLGVIIKERRGSQDQHGPGAPCGADDVSRPGAGRNYIFSTKSNIFIL